MPIKSMMRTLNERDQQILEMRADGYSFKKIASLVLNEKTGEPGISITCARFAYIKALKRSVILAERMEQEKKLEYPRSILQILMDKTRYVIKNN